MKYKEFEENIKNQFHGSTEKLDVDAFLDQLHKTSKKKRKKRFFWFFLATIFPLLAIIFYFSHTEDTDLVTKTVVPQISSKPNIESNILTSDQGKVFKSNDESQTASKNRGTENLVLKNKKETATPGTLINDDISKTSTKEFIPSNDLSKSTISNIPPFENTKSNTGNQTLESPDNLTIFKKIDLLKRKKLLLPKADKKLAIKTQIIQAKANTQKWAISILGEAGLYKPYKKLELGGGQASELFNSRINTEKTLEGLHFALNSHFRKGNAPFYINAGLSYTRISEQLNLKNDYIEIDTIIGITSMTQSVSGDTLTIIREDIIRETTIEKSIKKHYYFHLIDIPLGIGYSLDFRRFSLSAEGGILLNIYTKTNGFIQTGEKTVENLNGLNYFKTNVGISYYGKFDVIRPISANSALYLSTAFRYIPGDFASGNNMISQRYKLAGLNLGYRYLF